MRVIKLKKTNIIKFIIFGIFVIVITTLTNSFGMQNYYNVDFSTGLVTASSLNVRSGPRN